MKYLPAAKIPLLRMRAVSSAPNAKLRRYASCAQVAS
jgi:hypothetical protein